jgi:hypothetical protein
MLTVASETMFVVVRGEVKVGDRLYARGDVRIQAAGAPMPTLVGGAQGADLIYLIADRRSELATNDADDISRKWNDTMTNSVAQLRNTFKTS